MNLGGQQLPGRVPLRPMTRNVPLNHQQSWQPFEEGGTRFIEKTMTFVDNSERNRFLTELLGFEESFGHAGHINVSDKTVSIKLSTPGAEMPLDDDKAYSMFVDDLYRDVSYRTFSL